MTHRYRIISRFNGPYLNRDGVVLTGDPLMKRYEHTVQAWTAADAIEQFYVQAIHYGWTRAMTDIVSIEPVDPNM